MVDTVNRMRQHQEHTNDIIRRQQQRIEELEAQRSADPREEPKARRLTSHAADTLPSPIPSRQFPTTAARHGLHNRPSIGIPAAYTTPTPIPLSPGYDASGQFEQAGQTLSEEDIQAEEKRTKNVISMVKGLVEPFYADSSKDKGATVMDFVEKVETTMNDVIAHRPQYRLLVVRTFLKEGAMRWMNAKMKELTDRAEDDGRDLTKRPIRWDEDVRKLFIAAHVGTDTVELWLSKLLTLRLGSEKTPSPIELDSQFDSIARHVYPVDSAGDAGVDLLLTTYYSQIVFVYSEPMFNSIMRNNKPRTMAEWKTRLSEQFTAEEQIKAMRRTVGAGQHHRGSRGRGMGQASSSPRGPFQPSSRAAAMDTEEGTGEEGEPHTIEGEPHPQLSTAASGNQRGGRGGRGGPGRGRGSGTSQLPEWKQRLKDAGLCYNCRQAGHQAYNCSNPPAVNPQQSKEKAGQ